MMEQRKQKQKLGLLSNPANRTYGPYNGSVYPYQHPRQQPS